MTTAPHAERAGHHEHEHGHACDCARHRALAARPAAARPAGALSLLLPILACAVCPSCITTYAKVLSGLGVGFALTESQHVALLVVCVAVSIGAAARDFARDRRRAPLALTVGGCVVLVAAHVAEARAPSWLPWAGAALLLAGGAFSHWARRVAQARASALP